MMNNYKIYGLRVIGSNEIRYIGYTKRTLERRLYHHLYDAKRGLTYRKCNWIRKNNYNIEIVLLLGDLSLNEALEKEVKYIANYNNLVNMTKGGELNPMDNEEVRTKHSESMKNVKNRARFGKDNWMTSEEGRKWFSENNPMYNKDSYEKSQVVNIRNRKWVEFETLYDLYINKGMKVSDIANKLNYTTRAIYRNLRRLGIKKRIVNGD